MEFFGALFGFPGLGWLYAGQALVGVALLCAGPAVAWALIPFLTSPFADTVFEPYGINVLFAWLGGTGVVSTVFLTAYVKFKRAMAQKPVSKPIEHLAPGGAPAPVRPSE
jgi:hypothetical protein